MSGQESDVLLFPSTNFNVQTKISRTKISLQLLSNGHILVDWTDLPKHKNIRQCVIHWKSLNTNQSQAMHVSRKTQDVILKKIQSGHLYEIHVCTIDRWGKVMASSEHAQIQTIPLGESPTLRITKSTPDFIWLEWEKAESMKASDVEAFKLIINGQTQAILPPTENIFVVNDGELGERYIFQLEINRKGGKVISSLPISIKWPSVTVPKLHDFVNGSEELIICWGDSTSINDGNIESYTLHLYDSEECLLRKFGPNPPECRQVWINDLTKGVYFYILEMKLLNSNKSICSKPMKTECGRDSFVPILTCDYTDSNSQTQLINMAYQLLNIRDNMKSKRLHDKCEFQLRQILSILTNLTDSIRLNISIGSKSNEKVPKNYRLTIDNEANTIPIPWFVKEFPLKLPRREKPYELTVSVTPDLYRTKPKKKLVESSGQFSFFCTHFDQQRSIKSCSYLETFTREKQHKQSLHQGLLKSPQIMNDIQLYDLKENKTVRFPSLGKSRRLNIYFFYINGCVPSIIHLNYFSTYASSYPGQNNYISINCNQDNIDDLKELTQDFENIQCCTDFLSEDFEYEQNKNEKPVYELLSIHGVPTYFISDFSGRIIWRGRLCVQDQSEYNKAMDHIISEVNTLPCSTANCNICRYNSMNENHIDSEIDGVTEKLQSIVQERLSSQTGDKEQQEEKRNRTRQIVSMKTRATRSNENERSFIN